MTNFLNGFVEKLHILKRKADESIGEELVAGQVCKRRLDHLKLHCKTSTLSFFDSSQPMNEEEQISIAAENQWKKVRLNRLIVEHFLRLGYYSSAEVLADRCGIREISNVDIFQVIREVEKDLSQHNTSKCIMWCIDNKSKLRKINSNIEFKIRQQEFIELIRSEQRLQAVKHAQKYFSAFEQDQLEEIKKCMALLAFPVTTQLEPYKTMLDLKRWDDLLVDFRLENYRLFGIPTHSVLSCAVQTGLSALKTPQCYSKNSKNNSCPICEYQINELAESLPFSHCAQSRLICRVTKLPLNENNQPVALPNGHVIGEKVRIIVIIELEENCLIQNISMNF